MIRQNPYHAQLSSKIQSAVDYIIAGIESSRYPPGKLLPSIRMLAADAQVSLVTMWKAVKWLKNQNRITGKAGQMPRVAAGKQTAGIAASELVRIEIAAHQATRGKGLQRLASRVRKDILNGHFKPGMPLPLLKELEYKYHTSTRSLQKILGDLCREGLLESCGKGYAMPGFAIRKTGSAIGFIALDEYLDHYFAGIPQGHDYFRDTELYASQAGVRLIVEPFHMIDEDYGLDVSPESYLFARNRDSGILGHIYILSDPNHNDRLLKKIIQQKRPLSIIDQVGNWVVPSWLRDYPVRIIPAATTTDGGQRVGRYLLNLGHKKIAYISPYHPAAWSMRRYEGLCAAFAQAGMPQNVVAKTLRIDDWTSVANFRGDPPSMPRVKLEWSETFDSHALLKEKQRLEMIIHDKLDGMVLIRKVLTGLHEETLRDRPITAWVAANDSVAVIALEFLHEHGIQVPQDLSVVSFDDSVQAIVNQITSYNFNIPAIMGAAFRHIIQVEARPSYGRARVLNIDGMIVERQTAGKAPDR
jgi:DNA-binding LacI/PurR family transcriptional regulator/DNA-binding transcriptional regulator YhcF (GntR family)